MEKKLSKLLYSLMALSFVLHMFMPLTVFAVAYGSEQINVIWNCDNHICANNINVQTYYEVNGVRTYADNAIESRTLTDGYGTFSAKDATSYGKENYHNQYYIFETGSIDQAKAYNTWEALDEAIHEDAPIASRRIDPCGGKDGVNSVSHNGDRRFRLTIYDEGYEPITFNVDTTSYNYYLGEWDPVFTNPIYDISGSTEAKPLDYNTYLLEDYLEFSMHGLASVEALNVPNKGIDIRVVDSIAKVTFKSNYYSNVTFKLTLANGNTYYLRVNRIYTQFETNRRIDPDGRYDTLEGYASFIYPADKSYDDYDVYATITTTSGTTTKKLTAAEVTVKDARDGRVTDKVFPAGENLLKSYYPLGIDGTVKEVKITVTKKDAISGSVYGGTFGGYGEGVSLDGLDLFVRMLNDNRV